MSSSASGVTEMGNSESQYSIQGPKGTSSVFPGKPKPYSLKLRSAKDDALSPHTWWKSAPVGSGYKARCVGRGCLSPPKSRLPYSARHYDYVSKGLRGSPSEHRWHRAPGCGMRKRHLSDEYEDNPYGAELSGNTQDGHGDEQKVLEEQSSPRVVIKKDGSLRVEFTNSSGSPLLLQEASGPVQLLKFSPNLESASTPSLPGSSGSGLDGHSSGPPPASTSSTARTSKGSSLSSDGSWYDSPWGPGTELCEQDQPCSASRTLVHSPILQLDSFTEQSPPVSITDLYRDSSMAATFPTARDLSSQLQEPPRGQRPHRASFASVLDVPLEEECLEGRQYSSYTLPCRRPKAHTMGEDLDQYPDQEQHQEQGVPDFGAHKKDSIKNRIRRLSDWTGSLSRKKRKSQESRYKDLSDAFDSGVDGLNADTSSPSQVSSVLWFPGASRAQSSGAIPQTTSDALRQNIYENFMRELDMGTGQGGGGGGERRDPSTGTEEGESSSESAEGSLEELDLLFEKEQGVVRRAGWLSFKPLVTLHKDRKLELVNRRKWKQYWVTLKGCTLLFYETYGKGSPEHELSPRYALLAEDSIVQSVPEHPKKENVFCLSNSYGDVYLFQASNQTDLENWVTAIHSASASLLAKRQGKEDTVRLLRSQVRGLLQKIDMDGKMKKMAELQLTVVNDPKNRKAIENQSRGAPGEQLPSPSIRLGFQMFQIQQWEQNLERFNMDLFRMRCYLASLQGGELPNPKSLLAIASRPTKTTLGRLGIFSVSSFHALICSRDEATLRRRSLSLTYRQRKRGLFSSLKGLDNLTKRGRDKRPSASQLFEGDAGGQTYALPPRSTERLDVLTSIYSMSPPEGGAWDSISSAADVLTCVYMPDGLAVQVPVRRDQTTADLLSAACKVKQLDPARHCVRLHRRAGQDAEVRCVAPGELVGDVANGQLEVFPVNVFTLHMSRPSGSGDFGFAVTGHIDSQRNSRIFVSEVLPDGLAFNEGLRPGDEILTLNGRCVSGLDLALIQTLFAEQTLHLSLRRDGPLPPNAASNHPAPPAKLDLEVRSKHHRAKSSSGQITEECVPNYLGIDYSYQSDVDYIKCVDNCQNSSTIKRLSLKRRPRVAVNNAAKAQCGNSSCQLHSEESSLSSSIDDKRQLGMSSSTRGRPPLPPPHGSSLDNKLSRNEGPAKSQILPESEHQPPVRYLALQRQSPTLESHKQLEEKVTSRPPPQPQPRRRLASFGGVSSTGSLSPFTGLGAYNQNNNGNKPTSTGVGMQVQLTSSLGTRGSTGCLRLSPQSSGRSTPVRSHGSMHLQHVRDQMVVALQRLKELEEQVKIIPILQIKISVLQEEKRQLVSQLKNQSDNEDHEVIWRRTNSMERSDVENKVNTEEAHMVRSDLTDLREIRKLTEEMQALERTIKGGHLQAWNGKGHSPLYDKAVADCNDEGITFSKPVKENKYVNTNQVETRSIATEVSEINLGIYTDREAELDAQQLIICALKETISDLEAELKESALQTEMSRLKLELQAAGARNRADKASLARPSTVSNGIEANCLRGTVDSVVYHQPGAAYVRRVDNDTFGRGSPRQLV
ncbi:hypothetical protein F2P81_003707 [Scophthalmus maximus]|uniref:T-lymphoma invasion and metastasis-inducing protein 2-like n=1 Tax=Scophthalmus maximus TaxID=52904 RepID=A0A6A4TI89_SCOMX|nr:hypothetical protein F2P81_003707 [Scophthalmus maximus]